MEPDDLDGYGYFPVCLFWTVLLSALLHTVVGLKRTWDQKLSSGLTRGHLDVAITDLMLLTHMTIHLFQFSFADIEQYSLRPPPTLNKQQLVDIEGSKKNQRRERRKNATSQNR